MTSPSVDCRISTVHYVRRLEIERWAAIGWQETDTDLGPVHGHWSILMTWPHGSPIRVPKLTDDGDWIVVDISEDVQ